MPFSKRLQVAKQNDDSDKSDPFYCGEAPTGDPRVFGPITWTALHMMGQNYPDEPNEDTIINCKAFVKALPYMLPCSHCGFHLQEFINDYISENPDFCSNQANLVKFFVEAHNNVSKHTNPEREPWTVEDANKKYNSQDACFHNMVWGDQALCRDISCENPQK